MSSRKIAECLNVRVNVGNYQHIEVTKYAEEQIEYSSDDERIEKENALRDDLIASLMRSMKTIPEKLGKGVEAAQEVEEAIQKAIPEWLENSPVPNIANMASKKVLKIAAEQKDNKDQSEKLLSEVTDKTECKQEVSEASEETLDAPEADESIEEDEDLFEEDIMPEPELVEVSVEENVKEAEELGEETNKTKANESKGAEELETIFDDDDDDLFGDM